MCFFLIPPKNKLIKPQSKTIKDVPRSGCLIINIIGKKIIAKLNNNFFRSISLS